METNDIKPSTMMLIGGGIVLLLGTFLDWFSVDGGEFFGDLSANGWDTDLFGLLGIVCAAIGLIIGGGVAARQFGNVNMPTPPMGFSHAQLHIMLSLMAAVITIGFVFRGEVGIGLWLSTVAAIVMVVGSVMEDKEGSSEATPPTQF